MKGKAIIPLVLGLCIGLVAVKLGINTIRKAQASNAARSKIQVVRAKADIDAFTELTPELLEVVEAPDGPFAPASDRFSSIEELLKNQSVVTAKFVPQRTPILKSLLAPPGTPAGMEGRIPTGFRAVSVKIDEVTGVAYQLAPGKWVDVIVVMDVESTGGRKTKETIAEVILQRVQVAAIGQSTATPDGSAGGSSKVQPAKSATLLVPEEDVPKLHLAATRGKITLSMRGNDDKLASTPASAHSADLYKKLGSRTVEPPADNRLALVPTMLNSFLSHPQEPLELPHGVTVYRRTTGPNSSTKVERITFEGPRSAKVIDMADSAVSRSTALMRQGGFTRQQPMQDQFHALTLPPTQLSTTTNAAETPPADEENQDAEPGE